MGSSCGSVVYEEQAPRIRRIWGFPSWLVRWIGAHYRRMVDRAGIRRPNTFLMDFSMGGPRTTEHLLSVVESVRDGWISEMLTHPSYDGDWREEELRALLDPRVQERLAQPDIELVSFGVV